MLFGNGWFNVLKTLSLVSVNTVSCWYGHFSEDLVSRIFHLTLFKTIDYCYRTIRNRGNLSRKLFLSRLVYSSTKSSINCYIQSLVTKLALTSLRLSSIALEDTSLKLVNKITMVKLTKVMICIFSIAAFYFRKKDFSEKEVS